MILSEQRKIRVLIVDDSALIREMLTEIFRASPDIEVVGTATDPLVAREKIKALNPDVLTLDIEMPRMDGLSFLEKLMALRPMPVIIISTLAQRGADATLRALELGAVDCIAKPTSNVSQNLSALSLQIIETVKAAAQARIRAKAELLLKPSSASQISPKKDKRILGIGSSTGGVEALQDFLPCFSQDCPPIVIVQHMPQGFTAQFSKRMDKRCDIEILEAEEGLELKRGRAIIARGGMHLTISGHRGHYHCNIVDGPLESGHKPSVDCLFKSIAKAAKSQAVGAILTGMGSDGALGLLEMRKAGARTFGQDEESCLIYGMPKAARLAGAVEQELPLTKLAQAMISIEIG